MKAIILPRYGSPDVLELREVEKPVPTEGRVVVKVHASSVNPVDFHGMRGGMVRFLGQGLRGPKESRFGSDFAGVVEAVGSGVKRLKPGDEVFGVCPGGFAEYASAREDRVALKPSGVTFEEAAAVPVAGITALQALRDRGRIRAGQRVLINGASGGVGTFAVQIAKSFGAEVTAVCSTRKLDQARSIGADYVLDYTKEDFTSNGQRYDLICDVASSRSVLGYGRSLKPGGTCVIVGFSSRLFLRLFGVLILGPLASRGGKKVGFMGIAKVTPEDLSVLAGLLRARKVVPVIEKSYPLAEVPEAIRYLEEGHASGKIVINVD